MGLMAKELPVRTDPDPKPPATLLNSSHPHAGKRTVASGPPRVCVSGRRAHDI